MILISFKKEREKPEQTNNTLVILEHSGMHSSLANVTVISNIFKKKTEEDNR